MDTLTIVKLLFIPVFGIFGLMGCYQSIKGFSQIQSAKNWPGVEGTILTVELTRKTGRQKRPATTSRALSYRYQVQNIDYTGSQEYFGVHMASENEGTGGYTLGKQVRVSYNPDNPAQSVLKPNSYRGVFMPLIASLIFLLVVGYLVYDLKLK